MYLLQLCNVRKLVDTEAKRDALLALGYTEVKQPQTEPQPSAPAEKVGGEADKAADCDTPRRTAKAK